MPAKADFDRVRIRRNIIFDRAVVIDLGLVQMNHPGVQYLAG